MQQYEDKARDEGMLQKSIEIAKELLADHIPAETVAKYTKLHLKIVQQLASAM